MAKRLSLVSKGFTRRQDLDFSDDGSYFTGYDYNGLPITYCKYDGMYYLSIRTDYLQTSFTRDDWRKTEEFVLEDEFNGVSEVDVDKLVENCIRIQKKIDELNAEVESETLDINPVVAQLEEEAAMATRVVEEFKKNYKWYDATPYELKSKVDYMKSLIREIERCENLSIRLLNKDVANSMVRYYVQFFEEYGYVQIKNSNFYVRELESAIK